jgi:hypothetical protein
VRHVARMFVAGAGLSVPLLAIAQGLQPRCSIHDRRRFPRLLLHGGMGLEGYVRLGFHKEKEAIADPVEREKYYKAKIAELYTNGKAVSITSVLEIDEEIDLAKSRRWVMAGLQSVPEIAPSPQAALHRCLIGYREHCDPFISSGSQARSSVPGRRRGSGVFKDEWHLTPPNLNQHVRYHQRSTTAFGAKRSYAEAPEASGRHEPTRIEHRVDDHVVELHLNGRDSRDEKCRWCLRYSLSGM